MLSKIVYGKRGSNFDKVIFPFVRKALCTGSHEGVCECYSCSLAFSSHPDLMILNKDSYMVEDIDAIITFAESTPLIANNRVVLLKNLSGVTEISQNKLLKELEDNKTFILISSADSEKGNILPTIKSRTESIFIGAETREEFFAHSLEMENPELLFEMTGGYCGLISEMQNQIAIYDAVQKAFKRRDKKKLFEALNLFKDKDTDCYYEKYSTYLPQLFNFMGKQVLNEDDLAYSVRLLEVINKEKNASLSGWYSKINFFNSIVNIGEAL